MNIGKNKINEYIELFKEPSISTTSISVTSLIISGNLNNRDLSNHLISGFFSVPSVGQLLNFGEVVVGNSASQSLSIANIGDNDLEVNFVSFGGTHADNFQVDSAVFPLIVQSGTPQSLVILCSPLIEGELNAELRLTSNDQHMSIQIYLWRSICLSS